MYLVKYILLNSVCHSHTILFIAVSIKNIIDMSGNQQFVKTRACLSFIRRTAVRQDIASAVWRMYSQLAYATRNPATAVLKAGKFPPFLRKIFINDPQFLMHVFGRAPGGLQLCFVQLKTVAPSARYSIFRLDA